MAAASNSKAYTDAGAAAAGRMEQPQPLAVLELRGRRADGALIRVQQPLRVVWRVLSPNSCRCALRFQHVPGTPCSSPCPTTAVPCCSRHGKPLYQQPRRKDGELFWRCAHGEDSDGSHGRGDNQCPTFCWHAKLPKPPEPRPVLQELPMQPPPPPLPQPTKRDVVNRPVDLPMPPAPTQTLAQAAPASQIPHKFAAVKSKPAPALQEPAPSRRHVVSPAKNRKRPPSNTPSPAPVPRRDP